MESVRSFDRTANRPARKCAAAEPEEKKHANTQPGTARKANVGERLSALARRAPVRLLRQRQVLRRRLYSVPEQVRRRLCAEYRPVLNLD